MEQKLYQVIGVFLVGAIAVLLVPAIIGALI